MFQNSDVYISPVQYTTQRPHPTSTQLIRCFIAWLLFQTIVIIILQLKHEIPSSRVFKWFVQSEFRMMHATLRKYIIPCSLHLQLYFFNTTSLITDILSKQNVYSERLTILYVAAQFLGLLFTLGMILCYDSCRMSLL